MHAPADYLYELPGELIAQRPLAKRDASNLMVIDRRRAAFAHRKFEELPDILRPGDLLVVNDTAVIPARLLGKKESGGKVEVLIIDTPGPAEAAAGAGSFESGCLVKAAKRPRRGCRLDFGHGLQGIVLSDDDGTQRIKFTSPRPFVETLERIGRVPLPPYIRNGLDDPADRLSYQTVYAARKGAVAAPTAGLHFTPELMDRLRHKGLDIVSLTLHVGYGTFAPVRVEDIRRHRMHAERFSIPETTAKAINAAHANGRRLVAVGTTTVRTLEYASAQDGRIQAGGGSCDLFIYPGYRFKIVDAMITNFHLPASTLLMLVAAFAGRELILNAYAEAVRRRYRFYSYGDAMLIT
jgi:S-adenosylmethionine:tRNA ribosyltransferase-isomerase